ncbi:hypothetical protein JHK87_031768 [Glycine soja]|nr:hypothetical protein JHK87_031768 [Glycine soja]
MSHAVYALHQAPKGQQDQRPCVQLSEHEQDPHNGEALGERGHAPNIAFQLATILINRGTIFPSCRRLFQWPFALPTMLSVLSEISVVSQNSLIACMVVNLTRWHATYDVTCGAHAYVEKLTMECRNNNFAEENVVREAALGLESTEKLIKLLSQTQQQF